MNRYWIAIALAMTLAACSGDDKSGNAATNAANAMSNADPNNDPNAMPNADNVDNTGKEYAMSYQVLFDTLAFNDAPASALNGILAANMNMNLDFPVLVLMEVQDIDTEAGTIYLQGGSGLKTEDADTYIFDPEGQLDGADGTLDAATGEFDATISVFSFVATFVFEDQVEKTALRINELSIHGTLDLSEDGSEAGIVNGELGGYLTKEDGDNTRVALNPGAEGITLTSVFKEATLNYDTATGEIVENGTGDAWYLEGTFSAVPTTITTE